MRVRLADGVAAGGAYAHVTLATGGAVPGKKPSMTKYKRDVVEGIVTVDAPAFPAHAACPTASPELSLPT